MANLNDLLPSTINPVNMMVAQLRTVPTKYKGFCADWDHAEKVDLCKGYWNSQRKIGAATHFFGIISLESQKKKC